MNESDPRSDVHYLGVALHFALSKIVLLSTHAKFLSGRGPGKIKKKLFNQQRPEIIRRSL